jgi:hypothetical protein
MKKLLLTALAVFNLVGLMAQSVSSEKLKWEWTNIPLIKLPESVKTFTSNEYFLDLSGKTRNNAGDIRLIDHVEAATAIQYDMQDHYSQVFGIEVRLSNDNRLIYSRIFNKFGDIGNIPLTPGKPYDAFCGMHLAKQLDFIFADSRNKTDFKLYTIKKSTAHDDINQASANVKTAIRMLRSDSIEQARPLMEKAVDLWSTALKESNINDKKARINEKITEALYRNLIPTLIMLDRFDEAQKLINESNPKFGLFYGMFTDEQSSFMYSRKISYKAIHSPKPITIASIELPDSVKIINSNSKLTVLPEATVRKVLLGSWRVVSKKGGSLPAPSDTYDKAKCEKESSWTFTPEGKLCFQEEGNYADSLPTFTSESEYWQVRRTKEGKLVLVTADSPENFSGRFVTLNEIVYCTLHTVVIKLESVNPESSQPNYYYQLERVDLLKN